MKQNKDVGTNPQSSPLLPTPYSLLPTPYSLLPTPLFKIYNSKAELHYFLANFLR